MTDSARIASDGTLITEGVGRADGSSCPACWSEEVARTTQVPDHEYGVEFQAVYARCSSCGSEYQVPMPELERLARWYPQGYHSMQGRGFLGRMRYGVRLKRLRRFLGGAGALLDYGCGDGSFLDYAAERGETRELVGFEIAPQSRVVEKNGGKIRLICGTLDDLLVQLPPCRVVTMNHVIEHLPEPRAVMEPLVSRLMPGGWIEGQTPAAGCLEERVFGHYWSGYHSPRHTVVFSSNGLRGFLSSLGLREIEVAGAFNPAGLALSLASLPHGFAPGILPRSGLRWLLTLAAATALSPLDLLSSAPAVIDYAARSRA